MRNHYAAVIVGLVLGIALLPVMAQDIKENKAESTGLHGPYLGQKPPGVEPEVFAFGLFADEFPHGSPIFTPDGNEVYFPGISYMKCRDGKWTDLESTPFSGTDRDCNPTMSADGQKIYYYSYSMDTDGSPAPCHRVVEKNGGLWNEPIVIDSIVNMIPKSWQLSAANSGAMYFSTSKLEGFGKGDLYVAAYQDGACLPPVNLGPTINSAATDCDPFVSPEEDYIIFTSYRPGGEGRGDLYVSFRTSDGTWGNAINLGKSINSNEVDIWPNVTPDGKFLFFWRVTEGSDIYWVNTEFIDELKPKDLH